MIYSSRLNLNNLSDDQYFNRLKIDFKNTLHIETEKMENKENFITAEQSLKIMYPGLNYHVVDATQFTYWNRLDFPVSKIFKKNIDLETLRSWRPDTPTATGYEPYVQRDLEKVPRGAHTVFIHPVTQERMDQNPEYAKYIVQKIVKHFNNTIRIMKQLVLDVLRGWHRRLRLQKMEKSDYRLQ